MTLTRVRLGATVGLALALVALGLIATASASAAGPEWRFIQGAPSTFTGGASELASSVINVKCTSISGSYAPVSAKEGVSALTFHGCVEPVITKTECHSTGAAAGEIIWKGEGLTNTKFEYLSGEKHEAELVIQPVEGKGSGVHFTCQGFTEKFYLVGEVISKITPVNTLTKKFELKIKATGSTQEYTSWQYFEEGKWLTSTKHRPEIWQLPEIGEPRLVQAGLNLLNALELTGTSEDAINA